MTNLNYINFGLAVNELRNSVITKQHSKVVGISVLGQTYDPPSQSLLTNSGFFLIFMMFV